MGLFSSLFGSKSTSTPLARPSLKDEVKRQIEITEGELHEANQRLAAAIDAEIKASLEALVTRKNQALIDLEEKLKKLL